MKPIITSASTFSDLIAGGYLYVDKTAQIAELLQGMKGQYFLARPRRFGKSLFISTLKAIFEGRRELFSGLAISESSYDWKPYPIIHLNMGSCVGDDSTETEVALKEHVDEQAERLGISLSNSSSGSRFKSSKPRRDPLLSF